MATNQQGGAVIFGVSATSGTPPTLTIYDLTGTTLGSAYVSPNISGVNVNHTANIDKIVGDAGDVVAVIGHGEYLEATFELIPFGSTAANARLSSTLPPVGCTISTTGFDIVPMGPFADGFNVTTGSPGANKWIYEGGGSVKLSSDGKATVSLPLKRYPKIAGGAAIVD